MAYGNLLVNFERRFGHGPSDTYFSPGRLNLLGEYTDFNGGYVMPLAINSGTYFAIRRNGTDNVNVFSEAVDAQIRISLHDVSHRPARGAWSDYVVGVLNDFANQGLSGEGLDIYVSNDLPLNSGLSSSASFTLGVAFLLNDAWGCGLDRLSLVHIARKVENDFVGVQCGIMDQFAIAMGKRDHCIYLHCHSLDYALLPMHMDGYEIVITDSKRHRELVNSSYNLRRQECRSALDALRKSQPIEYLCAATIGDVESSEALRALPAELKRARHVISENERVATAADALNRGDVTRFGELMYASHVSLRDDFEVSCRELDILVETAMNIPGVMGSRMTGAGFGGCTFALVATTAVPNYISTITSTYSALTPYEAGVIRSCAGDGVKRLGDPASACEPDVT